MSVKIVTKQQRANALFARDVMWPSVPPKNVIENLADWREPDGEVTCGTLACFGGWVAVNPHFKAQGVYANERGAPCGRGGGNVAAYFLGDYRLFFARESFERGTDHEIVTKRLDKLIRNSVMKA